MGLFDKLFGKGKKDNKEDSAKEKPTPSPTEEAKEAEEPEKAQQALSEEASEVKENTSNTEDAQAESKEKDDGEASEYKESNEKASDKDKERITAAVELFPVVKDRVTPQRSSELCTRFINSALSTGEELKSSDFQGLSYNELCLVYNNLQLFTLKMDPKVKAIASVVIKNNTTVLRGCILARLKSMTLYTLYSKITSLPYMNNGSFFIFTEKPIAEAQLKASGIMHLAIKEIPSEQLEAHFDVFYITGYQNAIIDVGARIPFSDLYTQKDGSVYGIINPGLCGKMIFFNQMTAAIVNKAKSENRSITDDENRQINRVCSDIAGGLVKSVLLLPAEKTEDGKIMLKGLAVKGPEGKNWLAMFTDQVAINGFFKKNTPAAGMKNPILSQYDAIKDKDEIEGIIINPARESFRMPKSLLKAVSDYHKEQEEKNKGE